MYANQHRYDYSGTIVVLALERHRRMHCPDLPADAVAVAVLICPQWPCLCHPGQTTIYSRLFTNDCNRRWGTSTPRSGPPPPSPQAQKLGTRRTYGPVRSGWIWKRILVHIFWPDPGVYIVGGLDHKCNPFLENPLLDVLKKGVSSSLAGIYTPGLPARSAWFRLVGPAWPRPWHRPWPKGRPCQKLPP